MTAIDNSILNVYEGKEDTKICSHKLHAAPTASKSSEINCSFWHASRYCLSAEYLLSKLMISVMRPIIHQLEKVVIWVSTKKHNQKEWLLARRYIKSLGKTTGYWCFVLLFFPQTLCTEANGKTMLGYNEITESELLTDLVSDSTVRFQCFLQRVVEKALLQVYPAEPNSKKAAVYWCLVVNWMIHVA